MREYVTQALVLSLKPHRGDDRIVELFTKELGRVEARAVGGRKILSKVTPHLNPWNIVTVRLVRKRAFILADAIAEKRYTSLRLNGRNFFTSLEILFLVRSMTPILEPDLQLWFFLEEAQKNGLAKNRNGEKGSGVSQLLKIVGYNPSHATCTRCGSKKVGAFVLEDHEFICAKCATKFERNALLSIA